jgi:cyclopropane fatty-acyl-phospholipid synthase-like methyltransferase
MQPLNRTSLRRGIAPFLAIALLVFPLACTNRPVVVPFLGTPDAVARAMLELAVVGPNDVVYDLGAGDGRMVIMAAKEFGARGVGIDIDGRLISRAKDAALAAGVEDRVTFIEGDIFQADIESATVVLLYLGEAFNARLRPALQAQLKSGARVVSHQFTMGDWKPDAERRIEDSTVYLWRIE